MGIYACLWANSLSPSEHASLEILAGNLHCIKIDSVAIWEGKPCRNNSIASLLD